MKIIYMEQTLRLIAGISPLTLEAIERDGELKNINNVRYIVIEDGADL